MVEWVCAPFSYERRAELRPFRLSLFLLLPTWVSLAVRFSWCEMVEELRDRLRLFHPDEFSLSSLSFFLIMNICEVFAL
jgi:hypothetical protein